MTLFKGSCLCSAITIEFEADASPAEVSLCHCTLCRKTTSTAFTTNIVIQRSSLTVISGTQPKLFDLPGERTGSGKPAKLFFCGDCGTAMWSQSESSMGGGGKIAVKTGVLDGDGWEKCVPGSEVWCEKKANWLDTGKGVEGWESCKEMPPVEK